MFSGYFDESYDKDARSVFCIAGYVGLLGHGVSLCFEIEKFLEKNCLPYFKASQCESGAGAFKKYRDHPEHVELPLTTEEKGRLTTVKTEFVNLVNKETNRHRMRCLY